MLTVDEALARVLAHAAPLDAVRVPLLDALGLVLGEAVCADVDSPPFDNSAVDGYAVRAADVQAASPGAPVDLVLVEEVHAGTWPARDVGPGACAKVMTGAPIPRGADAMVMREDAREQAGRVAVLAPARPGDHVRRAGEDIRRGEEVLPAGTRIGPAETAVLAAMGAAKPLCIRPPRVAVVSTGDEVCPIEEQPGPGRLRNSNLHALAALVREAGARIHSLRHLRDDEAETEAAFRACAGLEGGEPADVIVTSGGVSVGDRDFVKPVLERLGSLALWRVKLKPGKPLAFGQIGSALFFGLPGNPVSTMVTFELFVRPALWRLMGRSDLARPRALAVLQAPLPHTPGRQEFARARVRLTEGALLAWPTGAQGSGMLRSLLGANALLSVPADAGSLLPGDMVEALLLDLPCTRGASSA